MFLVIASASQSEIVRSTVAISFDGLFVRNLPSCCCFGAAHSKLSTFNDNGREPGSDSVEGEG